MQTFAPGVQQFSGELLHPTTYCHRRRRAPRPHLVIAVGTVAAYYAHPLMQLGSYSPGLFGTGSNLSEESFARMETRGGGGERGARDPPSPPPETRFRTPLPPQSTTHKISSPNRGRWWGGGSGEKSSWRARSRCWAGVPFSLRKALGQGSTPTPLLSIHTCHSLPW